MGVDREMCIMKMLSKCVLVLQSLNLYKLCIHTWSIDDILPLCDVKV